MHDKWLVGVTRRLLPTVRRGDTLLGINPREFRQLWRKAANLLKMPTEVQPYGLRRGGATAFFQMTGSFSKTADRGRWSSERGMKCYITSALQEMASQEYDSLASHRRCRTLLNTL